MVAVACVQAQLDTTAPGADASVDTNKNNAIVNGTSPRFVKTNLPNLGKPGPVELAMGDATCTASARDNLKTKDFKVAKRKWLKWLMDTRGRVHAHEGNLGSLIEE